MFFFTAPRFAFRVAAVQDVVAAVVFLLVALVVGLLVARVIDERERAGRRERDARLLGYLATKLLSGEPLDRVLDDFAQALLDPFGLLRCEVEAVLDGKELRAIAIRPSDRRWRRGTGSDQRSCPSSIGDTPLGIVRRRFARRERTRSRRRSVHFWRRRRSRPRLAIERARLDVQVRGAQLDAETNQLRAALFSSVTHDLRTPLASIKAAVTSLLSEVAVHDPAQQRELLTTVLEETDRLNRLVGNLMDLAKIRAGALEPAREPAAIDEIVADGRRADATAAVGRPGALERPARPARRVRRPGADRSGPHEPAGERRSRIRRRGARSRSRPRRSAT